MGKFIDLTGKKFGRLTVLGISGRTKSNHLVWRCLCDCGAGRDVVGGKLTSGLTKSCGCLKAENIVKEPEDLSGMRFGRLTVIRLNCTDGHRNRKWECLCDCGNYSIVYSDSLKNGGTVSCGCYMRERIHEASFNDISDRVFGRLTVIEVIGKNKHRQYMWKCRCKCGKEKIVSGGALINGATTSCGCYLIERVTKHGKSRTKEYMRMYGRKSAETRRERSVNIDTEWTIEMESILIKMFPACVVCGGSDRMATDHVYPLSSGYGLKPGNATRLCIHCNSKKNTKTPENLPLSMPSDAKDKILLSALEFKNYWESGQRG